MNKDLEHFANTINHLIFLTTKDEHNSSRTKGIEGYSEFSDELNDLGMVPQSGQWTESSIKQFYTRVRKRYSADQLRQCVDLDFVGRSSWEYQSRTMEEEVREDRNPKKEVLDDYDDRWLYLNEPCGRIYNELELWSKEGADDPDSDYWKVIKKNF